MSNVAQLFLDAKSGKWVAQFRGQVLAKSPNKEYVVNNIRQGRCTKARLHQVTDVQELGEVEVSTLSGKPQKVSRVPINKRFEYTTVLVKMVAKRDKKSLIVTGDGGLGKSFTVNESLQSSGLRDITDLNELSIDATQDDRKFYSVVKGYSTAKGLYRTLWESRNRIVVFDDCDSVLRDSTAINLLKGALDSYDKRFISWNAESFGDDDLPKSFEFKGGVIFISNMPEYKFDNALKTRTDVIDLTMTTDEKIERMEWIIKEVPTFLDKHDMKHKRAALDFITSIKDQVRDLSFRTLISVTPLVAQGGDWKGLAEYLITRG